MDFMSAIIKQRRIKKRETSVRYSSATNALVLSKKKKNPSLKSVITLLFIFEVNIVCVFRAELTIKPPFLTKKLSVSSTHKNSLGFSFQAHAVACNEVK